MKKERRKDVIHLINKSQKTLDILNKKEKQSLGDWLFIKNLEKTLGLAISRLKKL